MTFQDWDQMEHWVYRMLELAPDARAIQLDELEALDSTLAEEVAELVEAHQHIENFLEPCWSVSPFNKILKVILAHEKAIEKAKDSRIEAPISEDQGF